MLAIVSLLLVVSVSILITRIATVALTHTGLSREAARFQARSAFTGSGFTTTESERVVNHPLRRRIVLALMLLGNAGVVTAVSSLILTFVGDGSDTSLPWKVGLLVAGLVTLWGVSSSAWVDRRLSRWIDRALDRFTDLDVRDYASLMQLGGDYRLVEMAVDADDWIADRLLSESRLREEGIAVLAIHRADGSFEGAPDGEARIAPGDELVLYGRTEALRDLDERKRSAGGELRHAEAVARAARPSSR